MKTINNPPVFRSRLRPLSILELERMSPARRQWREALEDLERREWDEEQRRRQANQKETVNR